MTWSKKLTEWPSNPWIFVLARWMPRYFERLNRRNPPNLKHVEHQYWRNLYVEENHFGMQHLRWTFNVSKNYQLKLNCRLCLSHVGWICHRDTNILSFTLWSPARQVFIYAIISVGRCFRACMDVARLNWTLIISYSHTNCFATSFGQAEKQGRTRSLGPHNDKGPYSCPDPTNQRKKQQSSRLSPCFQTGHGLGSCRSCVNPASWHRQETRSIEEKSYGQELY